MKKQNLIKKTKVPKFIVLFVLCWGMTVALYAQNLSLNFTKATLGSVLKEIQRQSEYNFVYNNSLVDVSRPVSIQVTNEPVSSILDKLLQGTDINYKIVNKQITLSPKEFVKQESLPKNITGRVVDDVRSEPVAGAYIVVENTKVFTTADFDGNFTLANIPAGGKKIVISCLGYQSEEVLLNSLNGTGKVVIKMKESAQYLNEVIVQGYGSTTVKDATGTVARLSKKEIESVPMGSTVQSMLQGRAAGVNVMIQSASPTAPISVTIRGVSTLSNTATQPLWVIDGVPDYSSNTSGDITNSLYNLNLQDVESIDILKDASATAIYGSRASNGVVIVTTKRGQQGQAPVIDFSARTSVQVLNSNKLKTLSLEEFRRETETLARQAMHVNGSIGYYDKYFIDESAFNKINTSQWTTDMLQLKPDAYMAGNTNWWDEMVQNAVSMQTDLSVRGGTEKSSYFLSLGYNLQNGMIQDGKSELITGRLNFETLVGKPIKVGVNLSASSRKANNKDALMSSIPRIRPDIPPFNEDGSINIVPSNTTIENPYVTLGNRNDGVGKNFTGTLFAEWNIVKGLRFRIAGTANYSESDTDYFRKKGTQGYASSYNYRSLTNTQNNTLVLDNTLNYANVFGKHDIVAVIGQSAEKYTYQYQNAWGEGFPDEDILININSAATKGGASDKLQSTLASFFGRINYKFNSRYLATVTMRADGSSKFGPSNRWGYFPSGALAWIISEEPFMSGINQIVPYLKLRASAGMSGSQNLGYYDWMTTLSAAPYNGSAGVKPANLGNPNLRWENTTSYDLGLDFGLLKERIRGSFGYYHKSVDNLIYLGSVPTNSSFSSVNQNVGSITNSGFEFDIRGDIIKKKDMTLEVGFNFATNSGKVSKLDGILNEIYMPYYYEFVRLVEGGSLGEWYGYKTGGRTYATNEEIFALKQIDPVTGAQKNYRTAREVAGDPYVLDLNGDGTITKLDREVLGNFNPKFFGGFNVGFTFKDLYVSAVFTYSYGAKRLWYYPYSVVGSGLGDLNAYNNVLNAYNFNADPGAALPRIGLSGTYGSMADIFVYDASFIRLNALNVSYRLPKKWFKDKFINTVEFNFQASNLFTITKYPGFDPQGNFSAAVSTGQTGSRDASELIGVGSGIDYSTYPSAKTLSFGIKLSFK